MGILDGIVEWIAEQVMAGLDLVTTSVLGALGCDMAVFLRYFPAAETMYSVFVALAIGIILLNWVWQLFKNFGLGAGVEAEDPVKLSIRSVIFILLTLFSDEIVNIVLTIGGTPYHWIMESDLPALSFADFNSVMLVIIGVCANGAVALITLILVLILAWNYLKLLFEAAERYVLLGVLVYTAPVAFSMGASQTTANIALICYADGEKSYILAPAGLTDGMKVMSGAQAEVRVGNCLPLENIPVGTQIHNIELLPGKGGQLVRSAGLSAQLMAKEGKYATLRLPSGEMRMVPIQCRATIGVIGNGDHNLVNIGKAGRKRHMGVRPTVRGSVMNPNDHPHGGGEGKAPVGRPGPCTPWGKPALGLKTRKKNKQSNKMIVRRRDGRAIK